MMSERRRELEQLVPEEADLARKLIHWAEVNSGSRDPDGLRRMGTLLAECMGAALPGEGRFLAVAPVLRPDGITQVLGAAYHHVCRPNAPLRILLSGHMDTVYGPESAFRRCAWEGRGRLRGPGVADMKGGLLVMLEGLRLFEATADEGDRARLGWEILITADEEIGSPGSIGLIREAAGRCHVGLVFESALPDGSLVRRRSGTGNFRLRTHGRAAHTGRDFSEGRNAIAALSDAVVRFHGLNAFLAGTIVNVGAIRGGGPLNIVPEHAEAEFNVRVAHSQAAEAFEAHAKKLLKDCGEAWEGIGFEWSGAFTRPPKVETPESELLHEIYSRAAESFGFPAPGSRDTGGASDGNLLAGEGLPHLDGVGVRGGAIHSASEFVIVESLRERILVLAGFLHEIARRPPVF